MSNTVMITAIRLNFSFNINNILIKIYNLTINDNNIFNRNEHYDPV